MPVVQPAPIDVTSYAVHELKDTLSSLLAKVQASAEAVMAPQRKQVPKLAV